MRNFGDPPPAQDDAIHLPSLIADEFGLVRSVVRMQIALGTVEIDGVESKEKFDFRRSDLAGKTVVVYGGQRQFKVTVPAE